MLRRTVRRMVRLLPAPRSSAGRVAAAAVGSPGLGVGSTAALRRMVRRYGRTGLLRPGASASLVPALPVLSPPPLPLLLAPCSCSAGWRGAGGGVGGRGPASASAPAALDGRPINPRMLPASCDACNHALHAGGGDGGGGHAARGGGTQQRCPPAQQQAAAPQNIPTPPATAAPWQCGRLRPQHLRQRGALSAARRSVAAALVPGRRIAAHACAGARGGSAARA